MTLRDMKMATGITVMALALVACGGVDETGLVGVEDCTNGVDDNGDGALDCDDPQCFGHAFCQESYREFLCDNGVDDDGDGVTDCDDPDCLQTTACDPTREWSCQDGVDNDNNGLTDCMDPNCLLSDACHEDCSDGVDNNGNGLTDCDDEQCFGTPDCVQEDCTNGLDDDGDGDVDCADAECQPTPDCAGVEWCDDGQDNNGDLLVDCDDPTCAGQPACVTSTTCQPFETVFCDSQLTGTTLGRMNNLDTYACESGKTFDGGELYFRLGVFPGAEVTVELTDGTPAKNLQLFLVPRDNTGPGCSPFGNCSTAEAPGDTEQLLEVDHVQFMDLYIIIDSVGPGGDFQLYVDCNPTEELHCTDGADNDNDGLTDCLDPDCQTTADCPGQPEICGDGIDNDYNGLVDCLDPTCNNNAACSGGEQSCENGIDDDGDGAIDCADPDCWTNGNCLGGETSCTNSVDDDGDLATDCWDYDCVGSAACDYWFDFDTLCTTDSDCGPPNHFCVHLGQGADGFCSRHCTTPGTLGAECATDTTLQGMCLPSGSGAGVATGHLCVLPCGAAYPNHFCPPNWSCHLPDPTLPDYGICVP